MNSYQHLNYFGQIVDHFSYIANRATDTQLGGNGAHLAAVRAAHADFVSRLINAQRFIIPDGGTSTIGEDIKYQEKHVDFVRLPYDSIAVLYLLKDVNGTDLPVISIYEKLDDQGGALTERAFSCFSAMRVHGTWAIDHYAAIIDPGRFSSDGGIAIYLIDSMECMGDRHYGDIDTYADEWKTAVIVDLCCALACCNVHQKSVIPSNSANRKRAKKGKAAIFEYKVLELDAVVDTEVAAGIGGQPDRNSPRTHLRRGHIRRLSKDRLVWVNACVVRGKTPGIVMKDYRVH